MHKMASDTDTQLVENHEVDGNMRVAERIRELGLIWEWSLLGK